MRNLVIVYAASLLLIASSAGPLVGAQAWVERNKGKLSPPVRYSHALAFDSTRQRVVLFGGYNRFGGPGGYNDTWEYDGNAWMQCNPPTSPSIRVSHAMAYDSTRQRVVLFGGRGSSGYLSDTWEWDGTNWIQRTPATIPPPRCGHSMAYDLFRKRVVLFSGGVIGGVNDTWEWDGNNWAQQTPSTSPTWRGGYGMVYDSSRQRVVLFGGSTVSWSNETWEWDGTNWTQRNPATSPTPRCCHGMAYDASRRRVVLFGGDDGSYWQEDTWEWDGNTWVQRGPGPISPKRCYHAMVYDSSRQQVVLFGGQNLGTYGLNDTWEYGFPGTVATSGTPRVGATVNLVLTAAGDAGLPYQAGSSFGTGPIMIGGNQIGLSPDGLLVVSAGNLVPGIFQGYQGVLDQRGQAQAAIHIPKVSTLVGLKIYTAFLTLDPAAPSGIRSIANTQSLTITS